MASMEFWGVDVKSNDSTKVTLEDGRMLHLSQATLSELKKDNEPVTIHVKVDDKKLVLGMLNQTTPQLSFDLVFEKDFEISHNWKNGSVHFLGYQTEMLDDEEDSMFSDSSDDELEDVGLMQKENGKAAEAAKPKGAAKPVKDSKPKPEEKKDDSDEDDSDDNEEDSDDNEDDSDEDMMSKSDDDSDGDDDDDDDEESEDEKPAKAESGKKRPNAEAKTPEAKKAKLATPQKTDGKKGGVHTATPHPSKKGGKTPGGDKSTPKSGGQVSCGSCKKTFNSDNALQSHNKAKHAAK